MPHYCQDLEFVICCNYQVKRLKAIIFAICLFVCFVFLCDCEWFVLHLKKVVQIACMLMELVNDWLEYYYFFSRSG